MIKSIYNKEQLGMLKKTKISLNFSTLCNTFCAAAQIRALVSSLMHFNTKFGFFGPSYDSHVIFQ